MYWSQTFSAYSDFNAGNLFDMLHSDRSLSELQIFIEFNYRVWMRDYKRSCAGNINEQKILEHLYNLFNNPQNNESANVIRHVLVTFAQMASKAIRNDYENIKVNIKIINQSIKHSFWYRKKFKRIYRDIWKLKLIFFATLKLKELESLFFCLYNVGNIMLIHFPPSLYLVRSRIIATIKLFLKHIPSICAANLIPMLECMWLMLHELLLFSYILNALME